MDNAIRDAQATDFAFTIVTTSNAGELIRTLVAPVSAAVEKHVRDMINASASLVRELNVQRWFEELEQAKAATQLAHSQVEEIKQHLADSLRELAQSGPANIAKLVVCLLCWVVCAAGEFAITWSTIPFVLNIPEDSFLGVAVSAVPVAALTVLEWVIARALEEPYQAAVKSVDIAPSPRRRMAKGLMGAFLGILLVGNLYTVRLLANAREESATLRRNLERDAGETEEPVNTRIIDQAIIAVSLAVVVDGALLFLLATRDLKNLGRRARARVRVALCRQRLPALEGAYLGARADEAGRARIWDEREARAGVVVEEFRSRHLLELQQILDREPATRPPVALEEMVDAALARGFPTRTMGRGCVA